MLGHMKEAGWIKIQYRLVVNYTTKIKLAQEFWKTILVTVILINTIDFKIYILYIEYIF